LFLEYSKIASGKMTEYFETEPEDFGKDFSLKVHSIMAREVFELLPEAIEQYLESTNCICCCE